MSLLACLCGGILEALILVSCAAFTWVASLIRLRWPSKPCVRQCCAHGDSASTRSD